MTFWNDIYQLRRQNLIPRQWRRKHLMPDLKDKYKDSTIWTVPSNAPGSIELIDEQSSLSAQNLLNRSQPQSHSSKKGTFMKNHRSIRLPSDIARKLTLDGPLAIEKPSEGLLLSTSKLSWEETARQMAESDEDWSCVEATVADGLDNSH